MNDRRTKHWVIHEDVYNSVDKLINHPHIQEAKGFLLEDEVVAFPTETVYGLGANAFSDKAAERIFEAKGRPSDNPLIVHIAEQKQLVDVVDNISPMAQKLMDHFWPGPLTLVLPKGKKVCTLVTAGLETVAVRMPQHPVALALIKAVQLPLAAPSANRSGKPSPTQAQHVLEDLTGRMAGVLDGGATGVGLESTVVDVTGTVPMILRPGGVTREQLAKVVGQVAVDPALALPLDHQQQGQDEVQLSSIAPKSPGVKYQHYAPKGEMWLVSQEQGLNAMRAKLQELVNRDRAQGYRVGVLATEDGLSFFEADYLGSLGHRDRLETVASQIYARLRECDQAGMEKIYCETFSEQGLGAAIMNRLSKAASGRILFVTD